MTMPHEHKKIEAEQVRAYFSDANDLNMAGLVVYALVVFVVHDEAPEWIWAPALIILAAITLFRSYLIHQYHRTPAIRSSTGWANSQALTGGLAGVCWGVANAAMMDYLPTTYQYFVLTVSAVVAATSTSEGFSLVMPPRTFTVACITPSVIWLMTVGDRIHTVLALMLFLFMPVTILLGSKKNHIFVEAQRLRFKNESLAKELSRQHDLLEGASKSKSRFLAAASHDLRQPLAALMIFLEQLEFEKQLSRTGKEVLEHAQQATNSLCSLLDGLLDISRLDGQAIKIIIRPFAIQKLFDELEEEFRQLAMQKGILLKFSPCSAIIESDRILTGQILRNLISNAVRYTPSGRVLVGCRHHQNLLTLEVHDTGIGIAEDQIPKIFDEFYQVDNPERDQQQGLGLGLSIVDRVARLLGHTVTLNSQLGKGTSFVLTVPLANSDIVDEQPALRQSGKTPALENLLIAVIENEGSIRMGMHNLLLSWGCRVVIADSAANMIEQLDSMDGVVEMVISDFGLRGGFNGVEAIAEIRKRWGTELPALLFTGDISKETYVLARNAGLSILYKPAKAEALRDAILDALAGIEMQTVRK